MSLAFALDQAGRAALGAAAAAAGDYPCRHPLLQSGLLRRRRLLPSPDAEVLVQVGERVGAGDVVARSSGPARATAIAVASLLGVSPDRAISSIVRQVGEAVAEGDVLAERRSLGGLQRRTLRSPVTGRVAYISAEYGVAYVEPLSVEVQVQAHIAGTVVEAGPDGVVIEGSALAVRGLAGAGPAAGGLLMVAQSPAGLPAEASGAVVACGFPIDEDSVRALQEAGAAAVLAAGIEDEALERLGWEDALWPHTAQAGGAGPRAHPPMTVVILGAGGAAAPPGIWDVLRPLTGRQASALGAEPGSVPELVVMTGQDQARTGRAGDELAPGVRVRAMAGRAEHLAGEVTGVSQGPFQIASEIRTGVADVVFPYDVRLRLPRLHLRALS